MATWKKTAVLGHLRTLFNVGAIRELTDGQLLERFATGPGEAGELAFAALVERHGPMVLRVCCGVLPDAHDAHDAFQATFLVLVRRARALWVHDSLGPWLHQVAYRTAMCARRAAARRRRHERSAAVLTTERQQPEPTGDLERVLHDEIDRLPERFRAPLVLCDLGGRTHEQAARHLGWPVGTVKSRLSRGRDRLRDRLRRRGLGPDAGLVAIVTRPEGPAASVPAALVHSTTVASMQLAAGRTFLRGSAATLAQGVLKSMLIARWLKAASLVLVAGATAFGVDSARRTGGSAAQARAPGARLLAQRTAEAPRADAARAGPNDPEVTRARSGPLTVTVSGRGSVEAASSLDVFSLVEGGTSIIAIVPEGIRVTKGQVVCELDSAGLRDQVTNQVIVAEGAKAAFQNARLAREIAQIALETYTTGTFKQQTAKALAGIELAESAIRRAEARLERTRRARRRLAEAMTVKGAATTPSEIVAELNIDDRLDDAEQTLAREKRELETARSEHDVLVRFTRDKTTKELQSDIEKARSDELAKEQTWDLEKKKQAKLEMQIKNCTLRAPNDGLLVYANAPSRFGGSTPQIEEGATVRERQKLFSVIDPKGPYRVNVKVPESMVDRVQQGMRTRINVDAFSDQRLTGTVQDVSPLPDTSPTREVKKFYTSHVLLEKSLPGLRPGMTADFEILISHLDNVVGVPIQAVLLYDDKAHVAVLGADKRIDWREVTTGEFDGKLLEIKTGIRPGEDVVVNPLALMSEEEKRAKFGKPTRPATKPDDSR